MTYCPGRFLAKQEIFMALAFLLCRNDVQLALVKNEGGQYGGQKFPRMDELKPGIGIIGLVAGIDLIAQLTPKVVCVILDAR